MLGAFVGSMVATLVQEATDAPPAGPVATALIGSGASLMMKRNRRPVGIALLMAGGLMLLRQANAAQAKRATVRVRPARVRPAPHLPAAASVEAA